MRSESNHFYSYKLGKKIIKKWIDDVDDLKTDIKSAVMDWLENYITSYDYESEFKAVGELDKTDMNGTRSSIEDALNDWCDENLFK